MSFECRDGRGKSTQGVWWADGPAFLRNFTWSAAVNGTSAMLTSASAGWVTALAPSHLHRTPKLRRQSTGNRTRFPRCKGIATLMVAVEDTLGLGPVFLSVRSRKAVSGAMTLGLRHITQISTEMLGNHPVTIRLFRSYRFWTVIESTHRQVQRDNQDSEDGRAMGISYANTGQVDVELQFGSNAGG